MKTYRFVTREIINGEVEETEICKLKTCLEKNQVMGVYRQFKTNKPNLPASDFIDYLRRVGFDPQVETTIVLD